MCTTVVNYGIERIDMAISKELRLKVESELRMGKKPRELAEKYGVSYPTVAGWRKKLDTEIADEDVSTVIDISPQVLHDVAERVKAEAPEPIRKEVDKLVGAVVGLDRLNEKMHEVAYKLLNRIDQITSMNEDLSTKEISMLAQSLGQLYNSFNNKSVTNVNVLNQNNINTEKREIFKASLKA